MTLLPIKWYQLVYGSVPSFTTTGRYITFADHLHITLWAGGADLNPVIQYFEETEDHPLEQVIQKYLESAARKVSRIFIGTFHAVIYNLGSSSEIDGRFTSIEFGLAYSQLDTFANFRYLEVDGLKIKLPTEVDPEQGRRRVLRYHRPPVI